MAGAACQHEQDLAQARAERDTAVRVALEAMRLMTPQQWDELRQLFRRLDYEGGFLGDNVRAGD